MMNAMMTLSDTIGSLCCTPRLDWTYACASYPATTSDELRPRSKLGEGAMSGGGATLKPRGQHHDFRDLAFLGDKFNLS